MWYLLLLILAVPAFGSDESSPKSSPRKVLEVVTNGDVVVSHDESQTSITVEGIGKMVLQGYARDLVIRKKKDSEEEKKCVIV